MKVLKKFFLLILLVLFVPICSVNAAKEKQVTVEDPLYYYTELNSKYGTFSGLSKSSNASKYTRYKHINTNPAYCVQSEDLSPKSGDTYVEVGVNEAIENGTWTKDNMWISGFIINLIDEDYSGEKEKEYVMTYAALNSYLTGLIGGKNFAAYNPTVKNYIDKAKEQYKKYFTTTLPDFKLTANNRVLTRNVSGSNVSYTGSFKLTGLTASFGETHSNFSYDSVDKVSYTIKPTSSKVQLCEEKTCKNPQTSLKYTGVGNDMEFFIKATNVTDADDLTITVTATNESFYNMGRLWKPKSGNSQILLGLGYDSSGHLTRKRVKKINFTLPDPDPVKKTITLKKFDSATGALLPGATLKLQLSGGSTKNCTISGTQTSCKIEVTEDVVNDITYSVTETAAPDGYILGSSIKNIKWNIAANTETCFMEKNGVSTKTDLVDCSREYIIGDVCKIDNSYTSGTCGTEEDKTGLDCDATTGICYSIETGEVVEEIPTKVIGEQMTNACYYQSNNTINVVDSSKCGAQYMKVTDSGNNLVVEYYNDKNRVVISKVAINGSEEVSGATLKICSNKPDASGKCNIVRNVLDGQCVSSTTNEDGHLNITDDVNCKNKTDDTKEVDMQWVSGLTPKIWYGLKAGTYYLVETVAPSGYLPLTTSVKFSIDQSGNITSDNYDKELDRIVIENELTKFNVIKKDADSGKVLSGAGLGICTTYKDENGNYQMRVGESGFCVSAVLVDGKVATWTTSDNAKSIEGLVAGTYYLVELNAPEGYTVAEPILFTLKSDGTIVDKDGKAIKDNTIVMLDKKIDNPKTSGNPPLMYVVIGGGVLVLLCGVGYYCLGKKNGIEIIKNKFKKNKK